MSRPTVSHICLAFYSLLVLNFATQCLAFPKVERRGVEHVHVEEGQSERMSTDDLESSSATSKWTPQRVVSEDPMLVSAGPSATSLNKVFSINKETHLLEVGFIPSNSPSVYTATEPVVLAGEKVFSSSQQEGVSPESRLSKAILTVSTVSLNIDGKGEPLSSTHVQPMVERTTDATQGFPKYGDDQLFATESQEGVRLGQSSSSHVNTKEMLTTNLRPEESEADTGHRTTLFPGAKATADTEPASLLPGWEKPSQMTADNTQVTAAKHSLTTSEYLLSVEPETDSMLGAPEITESVSTAVPAASIFSDEWDDTKVESVSQIRNPKLGDSAETQVRVETSRTAPASHDGMEGGQPLTEAAEVAVGLPEEKIHVGTPLPILQGEEQSPAFTHQSSFGPTSLMEDSNVSVVNLFQSAGGVTESTKENDAIFFLETTVSVSEYESEAYRLLGNTLKDIITQEMTTAVQEPEATLSLVTTLEVTRDNTQTEKETEVLSPVSEAHGVTQLSRRWETLATTVSTTAMPLSLEVTPAMEDLTDTITGPDEEFTSVWGSPVTPPGIMAEAPSSSPALLVSETPSERTVVPSITRVNTAATYGLDQPESEEGEDDEDEEDEEDEDEEEEDEEEDEEDKDADSLDESLDGDTELPAFTVPGVTSQEPGLEQGSLDPLDGVTYQVPDPIEWEQENQGLVRSWMEKLKDKAGYMSGMLVPVGVGIAGALFILGALYSIKVMNRRRRNGFKRHKRKQREFNSMQDRVMLLADSSEDEF
ncbi:armadillo-like helical domain-containing protein 4 [Tupaia chinensis]|uniref:armadillo-like helical domain-containing protein 4 n=1 Tax=Tupaia chinensis TaxID=246437 RepID=UPI0003C90397|nr:armadillo-like helical domain-containing protein 4 [Tupaia chinensis]